jgi:prevent-host-death family protein
MRTVAIRELQQNIRRVMELVELGETVEVTRRRRPIARLTPIRQPRQPAPWPDLDARARKVLGKRVVKPGAGEQILRDRDGS